MESRVQWSAFFHGISQMYHVQLISRPCSICCHDLGMFITASIYPLLQSLSYVGTSTTSTFCCKVSLLERVSLSQGQAPSLVRTGWCWVTVMDCRQCRVRCIILHVCGGTPIKWGVGVRMWCHAQLYACVVVRLGKSPHVHRAMWSAPALLPTPYSTCMGGCKSSHWWNNDLKSKKPSRGLKICTKSLDLRAPTLVKKEIFCLSYNVFAYFSWRYHVL